MHEILKNEIDIFFVEGLDRGISVEALHEFRFFAHGILTRRRLRSSNRARYIGQSGNHLATLAAATIGDAQRLLVSVTRTRSASAWPNGPRINHIARYREMVVGKSQLAPRLRSQLVNK